MPIHKSCFAWDFSTGITLGRFFCNLHFSLNDWPWKSTDVGAYGKRSINTPKYGSSNFMLNRKKKKHTMFLRLILGLLIIRSQPTFSTVSLRSPHHLQWKLHSNQRNHLQSPTRERRHFSGALSTPSGQSLHLVYVPLAQGPYHSRWAFKSLPAMFTVLS